MLNLTGIKEENIDALIFVFSCGDIKADLKKTIKVEDEEIEDYRFIGKKDIYKYLDERMAEIVDEFALA